MPLRVPPHAPRALPAQSAPGRSIDPSPESAAGCARTLTSSSPCQHQKYTASDLCKTKKKKDKCSFFTGEGEGCPSQDGSLRACGSVCPGAARDHPNASIPGDGQSCSTFSTFLLFLHFSDIPAPYLQAPTGKMIDPVKTIFSFKKK